MTLDEMKQWIDNASYEQLLSRWRFAPAGSLWFQGFIGRYYSKALKEKRTLVGDDEAVRVSKNLSWKE